MPKHKATRNQRGRRNNDPLVKKPSGLGAAEPYSIKKHGLKFKDEEETNENSLVAGKTTRKIMQQAKEQRKEVFDYEEDFPALGAATLGGNEQDEEFDENEENYEDIDETEEIEIDESDEKTISAFSGKSVRSAYKIFCINLITIFTFRLNLADMIMKKIEEKKKEVTEICGEEEIGAQLPEELAQHYSSVGRALCTYRSGKLPKVCTRIFIINKRYFYRPSN